MTVVQTSPAATDFSEGGPVALAQQRLEADAAKVTDYGAAHPADFGSVRLENGGPRVRLVVAFRDHVAEHCAALRGLLEYPDDFEIVRSERTEADLQQISDAILPIAKDYLTQLGVTGDVVGVSLRANGEAIAAQLASQYGDAVRITVGRFTYPDRLPASSTPPCPPTDGPDVDVPGVRASVEITPGSVAAGADFAGTVTLANAGPRVAHIETGEPLTAVVFSDDGQTVMSTYFGAIAGVGLTLDIQPGASRAIEIVGSTASCDATTGYALAPGSYVVRVPVEVYTMSATGPTTVAYLWSGPAQLTVAASQ